MNKKRNVTERVMGSLVIALFLGLIAMSLIAWCQSGKRAPRQRSPQPTPTTPSTPAPTPTPSVNPNPTPTTPTTPPQDIVPQPPKSVTPSRSLPTSVVPNLERPLQGTGIAPYFWDNLFDNPMLTSSILPMWENWWIRNRLYYLSFKEPIVWIKTGANGETLSVDTGLHKDVFSVLTKCLKEEKSPLVRSTAALALGKFRDKMASGFLKDSFKNDKDFDVKNVDVLSLGILGEESVINDLKMILTDTQVSKPGEISRGYAALALGYMNNKDTADALKEVLSNTKVPKQVQCAALLSLGNFEDKSFVSFIAGILNDVSRDEFVRSYAALALGRIKDFDALPSLKKALVGEYKNNIRASIAIAMGLIKSPDSKNDLVTLMKDKDPNVRSYAIISLAQLGDKSITPVFLETIKKQDYVTSGICVLALGILGDEKALPVLREIVGKKKNLVYNAAIIALGLLKDKDSVPMLIKIVKERESDTIAWPYAIQALGMIGDERAVPVLEDAFKKAQIRPDLGLNAYNTLTVSLAMLGKRKEVLTILYEQLKDKTLLPDIKYRILHGIGYIGDKTSIEPLVRIYNEEKDDEWVRMYAVFALGFVLDKEKINPLYKITANNNFNIWLRIIDHIVSSKPD